MVFSLSNYSSKFPVDTLPITYWKARCGKLLILLLAFKLIAAAISACAFLGVGIGVGLIFGSLVQTLGRNPTQQHELVR